MTQISIIKMDNIEDISALKQEVFEWAIRAALLSGFCGDKNEATSLYNENILDVFKFLPSKQHCFEIQLAGVGLIGRVWLMEKIPDGEKNSELRISYIKLDELYQRKGFSGKVIRLFDEYAYKNNFSTLSLNVFGHLAHAKKLYEKLGFQTIRELKRKGKLITSEMIKPVLQDIVNKDKTRIN